MYVVASESLRASMAVTSSRTPTRLAEAKIRNGSILYGSTHLTYGAPTQIQTFAYRWTHGSHIWSRPSRLPKAYWCISADPSVAQRMRKDRALTMAASRNVTVTESCSLTVVDNAYCAYLAIANPNLAPVVALFDRGFSFSASNFGHGGAGPWAGCYDHP